MQKIDMTLPSYLLVADDKIDLGAQPVKLNSLKAHLKYSLLFEGKILLTDAQFLRNKNFHQLILSDPEFRELFTTENITVALRDYIDFGIVEKGKVHNKILEPDLSEILKGFMAWDRYQWGHNPNTLMA